MATADVLEDVGAKGTPNETGAEEQLQAIRIPELLDGTDGNMNADVEGTNKRKSKERRKKKKHDHRSSTSEVSPVKQPKRVSPNYFVSIQITDMKIHDTISEVQQHVVEQQGELRSALIPLPTLHITLLVINLPRHDLPMDSIQKAMDNCALEVARQSLLPLTLNISGMGNFRDNIVYADISRGSAYDRLCTLAELVEKSFSEQGMVSTDSNNKAFNPHLTIFKLSKDFTLRRKGIRNIDSSLYESYKATPMGEQDVTNLQLCSMADPKDKNGYYPVIHQVILNGTGEHSMVETPSLCCDISISSSVEPSGSADGAASG